LWWDAVVTSVSSVPIGMLAVSGWWTRHPCSAVAAIVLGVCFLTVVEAQVFIRSHAAKHHTDVVCGAIQRAAGVCAGTRLWREQQARSPSASAQRLGVAALGLWCLMVAGYHWQPFDFAVDEDLVRRKLSRLSLVPFAGYRSGSDLAAFNNLLAKVGTALPLGVIAAFALPRGMNARLVALVWVVLSAVVFGAVEAAVLPAVGSDTTDVWLGMAASAARLWRTMAARGLRRRRPRRQRASAAVMALCRAGSSGVTSLGKNATTLPCRSTTYLLKFHAGSRPYWPRYE
jgi:hypothetical protein